MLEKLVFNLEILTKEADIEGIFVAKHWEEKVINHIFQSDRSLPMEKKNVWRVGHQRCTKYLRPLASRKPSRFLEIATDFRISARFKQLTNSPSESSLSTKLDQSVIFPRTKLKKM